MHPSARLRGAKTRLLAGRRIVLGVSGSIAAVESVKLAHELIRHGADVIPVLTPAAARLVGADALEYATGHAPIQHLTGRAEHVEFMDGPAKADLLLIAPATANTLAKVALGIDDTALTSFATVALGSGVPIIVAPAMHEAMGRNHAVLERIEELQKAGVWVIPPRIEEEKAKIADATDIVEACIHRLAEGPWIGRKALVISGGTAEAIDAVRVVANRTTGRMGHALALALSRQGADVQVWNGWSHVAPPGFLPVEKFETVGELVKLAQGASTRSFDAIFVPAALADFAPTPAKGKISSENAPPTLTLKPLPKVLPILRKRAPKAVLVGFKLESEKRDLVAKARRRLDEYGLQLIVANTAAAFGAKDAEIHLVTGAKTRKLSASKDSLAHDIASAAADFLPE